MEKSQAIGRHDRRVNTAVIAAAVLAGASLQSATGFGFALVSAPVAFALLEPGTAIWLVILLAIGVNGLTLATEGRRPEPLASDAAWLLAWSVPGALLGVALLRALDGLLLQALVTAAVLASLAARRVRPHRSPRRPWHRPVAGAASGALSTSTGTNGPPLVVYLLHVGAQPGRIRDTLAVVFSVSGLLSVAVLTATGTGPLPDGPLLAVAAGCAVLGHLAGRRVFGRLADGGYEAALALVLTASALGGLLQALG